MAFASMNKQDATTQKRNDESCELLPFQMDAT